MDAHDPRHGTYAGWHAHRREPEPACPPCADARTRYNRRLRKEHNMGRKRLVPIHLVRPHIRRLRAAGMTWEAIATDAGLALRTVVRAGRDPNYQTLTPRTARRLVSVRPQTRSNTSALTARRRLRALVAIGYPFNHVAAEVGMTPANLSTFIRDARPGREGTWRSVHADVWERCAAAYDRLYMTPGPSDRARDYARERGWPPPLAWNDVDDPNEVGAYRNVRRDRTTRKKAA